MEVAAALCWPEPVPEAVLDATDSAESVAEAAADPAGGGLGSAAASVAVGSDSVGVLVGPCGCSLGATAGRGSGVAGASGFRSQAARLEAPTIIRGAVHLANRRW